MQRVKVYLRTELFALPGGKGHVPSGVMIVDGKLRELTGGGVLVEAEAYADHHGRPIPGPGVVLFLPATKIDHVHYVEG
jgi:hypothetical protein